MGLELKLKKNKSTVDDIEIFLITHNRANLITQSLDSLLTQTVQVKKVIVLDNESTDDTEQIVKSYSLKHNNRVQYIKTTGPQGNYYTARRMASKAYCMLFHDDDILHPCYLENAIKLLNRYQNVALITTRYTEFRTPAPIIQSVTNKHYCFRNQNDFAKHSIL